MYSLFNFKNFFWYFFEPSSAYIYYKNVRINLLTFKTEKYSVNKLKNKLKNVLLTANSIRPTIYHCYYELGYLLHNLDKLVDENDELLIEINYAKFKKIPIKNFTHKSHQNINLIAAPSITLEEYTKAFDIGYNHLLQGDCYQFNLTNLFNFTFQNDITEYDFIHTLFTNKNRLAAFAHATYLEPFNELILSNSPECLFKIKNKRIYSYPIKGSIPFNENSDDKIKIWKKLKNSKKDRAELFIIIDLIRNDLSKINQTISLVEKKQGQLKVPGILHQYAKISTQLNKKTTLWNIINALFPGGSITGAPKKRVLEIIHKIENHPRGIYTGSTILLFKKHRVASINIRTAVVDFNQKMLKYGAGGGITLLSRSHQEFNEMKLKLSSFTNIFE
ncbi:MAG: chorismate-binding protein [Bacteriovoracaceae bacterium]